MARRGGVLVMAALPAAAFLAVDPGGWYAFGPLKWALVSTLVPLGTALVVRGERRWSAPLMIAVALLVTSMAVAAVGGLDPLYAWIGTPERHGGVLLWVLCAIALTAGQCLTSGRDHSAVAAGLAVAGLAVGALATAEALGWEPGVFDAGGRLTATFGSSAYLGAAVALLLPIALGVAVDGGRGTVARSAAVVAVPGLVVAGVGSGARAAWVGLLVAALVAVVARREAVGRRLRGRPALVVPGVLVGMLAIGAVLVVTPMGARIGGAFDPDSPGGRGRIDEWRVAARVVADHPVSGVGPEGYRIAFAGGTDVAYERAHGRDPLPDRAHSAPLDIAATGGIGAVAAWAVVMGLFGRSLVRALRRGERWVAGVAAGLLGYWVGQLLLFPIAEIEPVTWLLAGLVVADQASGNELRRSPPTSTFPTIVASVAVVALIAGGLDVAADRHAEQAVRAVDRNEASTAQAEAEAAVGLRPDVLRLRLLEGRARLAAGAGTLAALRSVDAALELSPGDPIAQRERARLLLARAEATEVPDQAARARTEIDALLAADPVNGELWLLAGRAARLTGDRAAAERAWDRAASLRPEDPEPWLRLAVLFHREGRSADARKAIRRAEAIAPGDGRVAEVADLVGSG